MSYFLLFNIFPSDIVYYIYKINKLSYANDKLEKFINNFNFLKKSFNKLLINSYNVNSQVFINSNQVFNNKISLLKNENLTFMKYLSNNYVKKSRIFWIYFLHFIGDRLNVIRNYLHIKKLNINTNKEYLIYRNFYFYWFKICKKYNIKLQISKKNSKDKNYYNNVLIFTCSSRNFNELKGLSKLARVPIVLDDNYQYIRDNIFENFIL